MANHSKQTGVKARSSYKSLLSSKQEERTGGKSRKALRDERDVERRVAACYAKRRAYKDIPKEKRELSRKLSVAQKVNERSFLTLYAESLEDEEIVTQSGGAVLKGVLGGGAALTAWLLSKGIFDIGSASKKVASAMTNLEERIATGMAPVANSAKNAFDSIKEAVDGIFVMFKKALGSMWSVPALLLLYALARHSAWAAALALIVVPWAKQISGGSWRYVERFFPSPFVISPQAGEGPADGRVYCYTHLHCNGAYQRPSVDGW